MGLAHPRRAEQEDIGLDVVRLGELGRADACARKVEVVADGDRERALGIVLSDDMRVEMVFHAPRSEVKIGKRLAEGFTSRARGRTIGV